MINLKNVEAICIDGTIDSSSEKKYRSILKGLKDKIYFKSIKYFSYNKIDPIENVKIILLEKPILTRGEYSGFVMSEMPDFVEAPLVMILHPDGFPINLNIWDDEFLNYDYMGAPWGLEVGYTSQHYYHGFEGGNGGFNIRSKKLMDLCKQIDVREEIKNNFHEDGFICGHLRPWLKQNGCKFAPYNLSKKFSLETSLDNHHNDVYQTFGFHGHRHITFDHAIECLNKN
jgi:hypothetical protein